MATQLLRRGGCMLNLVLTIVLPAILYSLSSKGSHMENRIDKIDVKKDHKELIALFYRIELRNFVNILLYQHSNKSVTKYK